MEHTRAHIFLPSCVVYYIVICVPLLAHPAVTYISNMLDARIYISWPNPHVSRSSWHRTKHYFAAACINARTHHATTVTASNRSRLQRPNQGVDHTELI